MQQKVPFPDMWQVLAAGPAADTADMNIGLPAVVAQAAVGLTAEVQAAEVQVAGSGSLNCPDLSYPAGSVADSAGPMNQTDLTGSAADSAGPMDHSDLPDPTGLPDCPETDHPFFSSFCTGSLTCSTFLNLITNNIIPTHTKRMLNHCAIESGPINPLSSSPRKNSHINLTIP